MAGNKRSGWIGLAALAALAACEDGAPEPERTAVKAANPISDQLKGLSEVYRFLGLRRAIVDNGQRCKRVDRGGHQEEYKTMAMWTAHCTDTGDWAIFIAPNASVQVRRCGNLASIGLPACRMPAAPAGDPESNEAKEAPAP
jgi:hypothetical protein